jgi:hypothetical protein
LAVCPTDSTDEGNSRALVIVQIFGRLLQRLSLCVLS